MGRNVAVTKLLASSQDQDPAFSGPARQGKDLWKFKDVVPMIIKRK